MISLRVNLRIESALAAALCSVAAALLLGVGPAAAHPLGNTSVNVYERIEVASDAIHIRYVLDVSEIPAAREERFADTDDDGTVDESETTTYLDGLWEYVSANLSLTIDGQTKILTREHESLTFPAGQGGLILMRAVFDASAPLDPPVDPVEIDGTLTETTFDGVPGWHEIIVVEGSGATLGESSVPAQDISDELTSYPPDRLENPLLVREASFAFALNPGSVSPSLSPSDVPAPVGSEGTPAPNPLAPDDPLVDLVGSTPTLAGMALGVLVALALGAAHAISPGHGKALVAAYVLGSRASIGHAMWLGMTVAVTHTAGVLVLGVLTYLATELLVPGRVVGWLSVASGLMVLALGAILFWRAWKVRGLPTSAEHHVHPHVGAHRPVDEHSDHAVTHDHVSALLPLRRRDVALLGIVGGLIPSTSALLLLLSSVSLGQVGFGIILIFAFGVGMALVLTGISVGIVLVRRSRLMAWQWRDPRLARIGQAAPLLSGVFVIAFGMVVTIQAAQSIR